MTIKDRKGGWLESNMHSALRELLIHICSRYHIACPAYCFMPDHAHFLWMGLSEESDQMLASKTFRKHWNQHLRGKGAFELQKQPYEHVLEETERNDSAFEDTLLYILSNPEKAKLTDSWRDWSFLGAIVAGYPDLDPRNWGQFLPDFWKLHHLEVERLRT